MTDQPEITTEGMRCLLVAMGAKDAYGFLTLREKEGLSHSYSEESWAENRCHEPWFVLACLRFLESEKVREKAYIRMYIMADGPEIVISPYRKGGATIFCTDPDPAVRIVKAAIAAAVELLGL